MTMIRAKGLKRYRSKGRWYAYHRATGKRLAAEYGTAAFFQELNALEDRVREKKAIPGTLGMLFESYRGSLAFLNLAPATREGYLRMINLIARLHAMPLTALTSPFVAALRDKLGIAHGRRQANYVLAVISVAAEHGKEHGFLAVNPVKGLKRIRRPRSAPTSNRPWTTEECRLVLDRAPSQLLVPIALSMYTGLRKGDALTVTWSAVRNGRLWKRTAKTGQEVSIPLHPELSRILDAAPKNDVVTVSTTSRSKPWTPSGFNASFIKFIATLERANLVADGLTFHGLRHTVGTRLIEGGCDLDTVRRWLGQKTLAMAIHYSANADASGKMDKAMSQLDPLGSKTGT